MIRWAPCGFILTWLRLLVTINVRYYIFWRDKSLYSQSIDWIKVYIQIFQPRLDKTAHTESADPRFSKTSLSLSPPHPIQLYALYRYSLVLNRRPASCIWHNLEFPWSCCIENMFLRKKVGLSCVSPWFWTFLASFLAWCHCYIYGGMPCLLVHPALLFMSLAVLVFIKNTACLLRQHVFY